MKKLYLKIALIIFGLGITGSLLGFTLFSYFNLELPKLDKLQDYHPNLASQIISKDGVILAEIGLERREIVDVKDIPPFVINSFLSAEDDKFYEHNGVDYLGLARAMFANFRAGKVVQGGSTITQQVAKSLLLNSERSFARKIKDFILAKRIEEKLTKQEILYLYLNQVYLGGGYYGVKAAAKGYYNKDLNQMTIAEAAMLAGLLVAPGKYSPYINPHAARKRQHYVLERLFKLNKISKKDYDEALLENTKFYLKEDEIKAGYFTEFIRQKVVESVGEKTFLTGGLKIKTSLNWELQKVAEDHIEIGLREIDKRQGYKGPQGHLSPEEMERFDKENRKNIFKKVSTFFTINPKNNEKIFEFNADIESFFIDHGLQVDEVVNGNKETDPLLLVLTNNKPYEAIVLSVDDASRLIFVSIGGSHGFIPFEYFKWAHKRSINENTSYYQELTRPSQVLKKGDLIYVQVLKKNESVTNYLNKDATLNFNRNKNSSFIKSQRYILCQLDQIPEVQGALLSIDSKSGEIISFVGGRDFKISKYNRVIQAKRQPGSSFKPILYSAALEHGFSPTTIIMDTPEAMPGFDAASSWKPRNYEGDYKGPITMREALEESRNVPTIKMADRIGVNNILKFAERIHFGSKLEPNLSIALGAFGVTPWDMVKTYAIYPNLGKLLTLKPIANITDQENKKYPLPQEQPFKTTEEANKKVAENNYNPFTKSLTETQVYDPRLAYVMTSLMHGVVMSGTAASAKEISPNLAGKTGTTNDYIDAWFVGYSSNLVTAVWTGFDDNKTLGHGESGARAALPIWKNFMKQALAKFGDPPFEIPPGVSQVWINKSTGKRVAANTPGAFLESLVELPESELQEPPAAASTTGNETNPLPTAPPAKKKGNSGDDEYFDNQ